MNRLELAALAPPVPDWYEMNHTFGERIRNIVKILETNNKNDDYYYTQLAEAKEAVYWSWVTYWADEMIKRNEK